MRIGIRYIVMSYTSSEYFVFLLLAVVCYYIIPKKGRWVVLLLASYAFYFYSSRKYIIFIIGSAITIYLIGLWLSRIDVDFKEAKKGLDKEAKKALKAKVSRKKRLVVWLGIVLNFIPLVFLKYFNFFSYELTRVGNYMGIGGKLPIHHFLLPLGISFYTLAAVSYISDVYRGKYAATRNPFKLALFLGFFPHIVEGPIGRFDLLGEQLYEGHSFDYARVTQGIQLMFWGLFKKLVVADRAAIFVDTVFNDYTNYSGMYVVIAMLLYTLQLYAEFSGCMDIVMGSAEIFGVKLDKNFERPFISKTVSEFWRRWHMTLGGWFRDYVFYPISLSKSFTKFSKKVKAKCSPFVTRILPAAMAMFVVWFGTGIWHGASLKYIMYGLYYYIIMVAGMLTEPLWCRLFDKLKVDRKGKVYRALQVVRTFIFVNIGMLLFRTDNMGSFFHMFRSMFSNLSLSVLTDGSLLNLGIDKMDITVIIIGLIFIIIAGVLGERGCNIREAVAGKNIVVRWVLYYALVLAVLILGAYGFNYPDIGFIYAQF